MLLPAQLDAATSLQDAATAAASATGRCWRNRTLQTPAADATRRSNSCCQRIRTLQLLRVAQHDAATAATGATGRCCNVLLQMLQQLLLAQQDTATTAACWRNRTLQLPLPAQHDVTTAAASATGRRNCGCSWRNRTLQVLPAQQDAPTNAACWRNFPGLCL